MSEHPAKRLGCCSICDTPVFELGPGGRLAEPKENAVRAKVILIDGTLASLTLCADCAEAPDYVKLFDVMLGAWALELDDDYRKSCGGAPLTEPQRAALRAALDRQRTNVPIGLFHRESWSRALQREASRKIS